MKIVVFKHLFITLVFDVERLPGEKYWYLTWIGKQQLQYEYYKFG